MTAKTFWLGQHVLMGHQNFPSSGSAQNAPGMGFIRTFKGVSVSAVRRLLYKSLTLQDQ